MEKADAINTLPYEKEYSEVVVIGATINQSMTGAEYYKCVFIECDFSGMSWENVKINGCVFIRCKFANIIAEKSIFDDCVFALCKFDVIHFYKSLFFSSVFELCEFICMRCNVSAITSSRFRECTYNDANFRGAILTSVRFHKTAPSINDILGAKICGLSVDSQDYTYLGTDTRGYGFFLSHMVGVGDTPNLFVMAGCRDFTLTEASKHWKSTECMAFVSKAKKIAKKKGWM